MSQDTFLSSESDNHLGIFYIEQQNQKLLLIRNLLGGIHSSASPLLSRISPRLDWITLFVKLPRENCLSSKSDNLLSMFFCRTTRSKNILFQDLLGGIHSSSSPQFSRLSQRLDWKTLLVKLSQDTFLSSETDNQLSKSFVEQPNKKILFFQNLLKGIDSSSSHQLSRIGPRLNWKSLFV